MRFPPPTLLVVLVDGTEADAEALREESGLVSRELACGFAAGVGLQGMAAA